MNGMISDNLYLLSVTCYLLRTTAPAMNFTETTGWPSHVNTICFTRLKQRRFVPMLLIGIESNTYRVILLLP